MIKRCIVQQKSYSHKRGNKPDWYSIKEVGGLCLRLELGLVNSVNLEWLWIAEVSCRIIQVYYMVIGRITWHIYEEFRYMAFSFSAFWALYWSDGATQILSRSFSLTSCLRWQPCLKTSLKKLQEFYFSIPQSSQVDNWGNHHNFTHF